VVVVLVAVAVARPRVDRGLPRRRWLMGRRIVRWRGWRWRRMVRRRRRRGRGWRRRRMVRRRRRRRRRMVRRRRMMRGRRVVRRTWRRPVMRRSLRAVSRRLLGMRGMRFSRIALPGSTGRAGRLGVRHGRRVVQGVTVRCRMAACAASATPIEPEVSSHAWTSRDDDARSRQVRGRGSRQRRRSWQQNNRTRSKRRRPELPGEAERRHGSDDQEHT
jgi:hypothetical protein